MKTSLICDASLTMLTACGGTSGSNGGVQPIVETHFANLEDTAAELTDKYGEDVLNSNFTSASSLPTRGSANFSGAIGIAQRKFLRGEQMPRSLVRSTLMLIFLKLITKFEVRSPIFT